MYKNTEKSAWRKCRRLTFERERVAIERKITVNRREKNYIAFI